MTTRACPGSFLVSHATAQLSLTAPPVRGEGSTLPFDRGGPRQAAGLPPEQEMAAQQHSRRPNRAGPEAGIVPFMPAGSPGTLCGLVQGSRAGCRDGTSEIQPDFSEQPDPGSLLGGPKIWLHGTDEQESGNAFHTLSSWFQPVHPTQQPLPCPISYLDGLVARQRDLKRRDMDLAAGRRRAQVSTHSRHRNGLETSPVCLLAAHTCQLGGWGTGSAHLPSSAEMQRDLGHLSDGGIRGQVRAKGE